MVGKGGNLKVFLALNNLGYTHNSAFLDFNIFEGNVHVGMRRETVNDAKSWLLAILGLGRASSMAPRTPPLKRSRVVASSEGDPSRTSSKKPRRTPLHLVHVSWAPHLLVQISVILTGLPCILPCMLNHRLLDWKRSRRKRPGRIKFKFLRSEVISVRGMMGHQIINKHHFEWYDHIKLVFNMYLKKWKK